jgi:protein gp37
MGKDSKIEWCHHTANLWIGCTEVHAGCDNCYARVLSNRWGNKVWGNDAPRKEVQSTFNNLDKFQKLAQEAGEVHRVFVGSMMDIFEKPMPVINSKGLMMDYTTEALRAMFFQRIHMGRYPNLIMLLLTKRPSNIPKYIPAIWKTNPPDNVMFGYSPVDPPTFKLVDQLRKVKGKLFLSVEPQLADIQNPDLSGISWLIQGGESGHHKRPFKLAWARSMRDHCAEYGVPYFFKQIDKIQPIPEDLQIRQFPK